MIIADFRTACTWTFSAIVYMLELRHLYHAIKVFNAKHHRKLYHYIHLLAAFSIVVYHPIVPISSSILFPEIIERQYQPLPGLIAYPVQFATLSILVMAMTNRILLFVQRRTKFVVLSAAAIIWCLFTAGAVAYVSFTFGGDSDGTIWTSILSVAFVSYVAFELTGMLTIVRCLLKHRRASRKVTPIICSRPQMKRILSLETSGLSHSQLIAGQNTPPGHHILAKNKQIAPISASDSPKVGIPKKLRFGFSDYSVDTGSQTSQDIAGDMPSRDATVRKQQEWTWNIFGGKSNQNFSTLFLQAKVLVVCQILVNLFGLGCWLCFLTPSCFITPEGNFMLGILSDAIIGLQYVISLTFLNTSTSAYGLKN
ncbi:hypothetical protein BJ742DRAFT_819561 [Cladochytrium replicatum]|nr:hypothetical protein BJ742DRAFT_819561 [Cladochytrium replicatum]